MVAEIGRAPSQGARLVVLLAATAAFLMTGATPALAHATLTSSSPADGAVPASAPASVRLTFDEAVRPVPADTRVIDPAGRSISGAVAGNGATVTIALRATGGTTMPGTYTVSWRVISADSHPVAGAVSFSIGHPSRPATMTTASTSTTVSTLLTIARFLGYAGFALLVGAVAFCCYGWPDGTGLRGIRLLIVMGWAVLAAGTFSALLLQGPYGAGAGLGALARPELLHQTLGTVYGKAMTVRLLLVGSVPGLLAYALSRLGAAGRAGRALFSGIGTLTTVGLAATWSIAGHPGSGAQPVLAVSADAAHLCAMAGWLGGLAAVAVTVRTQHASPDAVAGVVRFSTVAASCVTVLALSGLYQAWLRVQTLPALPATTYGVTLIVKVSLVAAVLSVAFFSRRLLHRRPTAGAVPPRLGQLVTLEAGGALTVVAMTALLVGMEPADTALAARPATLTTRFDTGGPGGTGSLSLHLPDQARGLTQATLVVRDPAGASHDVPGLQVTWSLPARAIGPITALTHQVGTGRYTAVTAPLTVAGQWRIAVTVRTSDIDETTVQLTQTLR